jgi:hypothetical protein
LLLFQPEVYPYLAEARGYGRLKISHYSSV